MTKITKTEKEIRKITGRLIPKYGFMEYDQVISDLVSLVSNERQKTLEEERLKLGKKYIVVPVRDWEAILRKK